MNEKISSRVSFRLNSSFCRRQITVCSSYIHPTAPLAISGYRPPLVYTYIYVNTRSVGERVQRQSRLRPHKRAIKVGCKGKNLDLIRWRERANCVPGCSSLSLPLTPSSCFKLPPERAITLPPSPPSAAHFDGRSLNSFDLLRRSRELKVSCCWNLGLNFAAEKFVGRLGNGRS